MQTQAEDHNGAALPDRSGTDSSTGGGHRRRPGQSASPALAARGGDLNRLAAPLPPGTPIIDWSRRSHPSFQDDARPDVLASARLGSAGSAPASSIAAPIFVDSSGQRRKLARRLSIGVVGLLGGYACLVAVSFAGGPIPPAALLPLPGMPAAKEPPAQAVPAAPPTPSGPAGSSTRPAHQGGLPTDRFSEHTPAHGSPIVSTPSGSAASAIAPTSALPTTPLPTGPATGTSTQSHGNPTPPGRLKHSTPASGATT